MSQEKTPETPALLDLARRLHAAGRLDESAGLCFEVMRREPGNAPAHHLMGVIAHQKGRNEEAVELIGQAIVLDVRAVEPHHDLAVVLAALGRADEARETLERVVDMAPDFALGHYSLGTRLMEQTCWAAAVPPLERAVALRPDHVEAWSNLSKCRLALGDEAGALAAIRRAVALRPGAAMLNTNHGNLEHLAGDQGAAKAAHREALRLDPQCADAHFNLAACLLIEGDLAEGWREYEWRFRSTGFVTGGIPPFAHLRTPRWEGAPMRSGRLLVHYEQGFGDTIQFARYLPLVKERVAAEGAGAEVVFACQNVLAPLLGGVPGPDRIHGIELGKPYDEPHEARVSLISLARIFATTLKTVPAAVPYLRADPALVARWGARLAAGRGLKVGLCWQGNPRHLLNRRRSIDPALLAALARVPGVTLYGLQKAEAPAAALVGTGRYVDLGPELDAEAGALMDTAAVMAHLDLVVSVDTSIAHLAGALARPCWVLLAAVPDWRWLLEGERSPWYPTLRLFRQARPRDWAGVIARVSGALERLAAGRGGGGPA